MSDAEDAAAPRGQIGQQIFEQVERLVAEENLSRTQAFQRLSEQTGRRAGTVAANYYRVARQRGAPLQPRRGRPSRARAGRDRRRAGSAETALRKVSEALADLTEVVRRQDQELAALREQTQHLDELRRLLARTK